MIAGCMIMSVAIAIMAHASLVGYTSNGSARISDEKILQMPLPYTTICPVRIYFVPALSQMAYQFGPSFPLSTITVLTGLGTLRM